MELVVGVVVEHGLSFISTDQALLQKAEESRGREPTEVIVNDPALNEIGGLGRLRGTV